jgi:hypothetical protein
VVQLGDNMLESSCHVLQAIPYDPLTGVLRGLGPLYAGNFIVDSDILAPLGLRESTPVPEPGSLLLLGMGLAGLAALRHRSAGR